MTYAWKGKQKSAGYPASGITDAKLSVYYTCPY